jgi:hypothetical protein
MIPGVTACPTTKTRKITGPPNYPAKTLSMITVRGGKRQTQMMVILTKYAGRRQALAIFQLPVPFTELTLRRHAVEMRAVAISTTQNIQS